MLFISLFYEDLQPVIPAKPAPEVSSPGTGIKSLFSWLKALDPGFRRGDDFLQHVITLLTMY